MKVPYLDLHAHHAPHRAEFDAGIKEVIDTGAFAGGPIVKRFEEAFAEFCQSKHAIGVASGTDALWLALLAMDVGAGDEVITVPNSFIATAEAISYCGAKPVFVDVDERTYTMDPSLLEAAITDKTKAIIPVHLFGQPADMDPILEIAKKHNLRVIEDAAQAHGAEYKGRRIGTLGDAACFSFYPGKNLGAFGEAGAISTNCDQLRKDIEMFRDHGQVKKYHSAKIGWNGRMDGIQAAVLSVKLKHLDKSNKLRHSHALRYDSLLGNQDGIVIPHRASDVWHVYHVYEVRVQNRDAVMAALDAKGIGCGIHYPVPIHLQEAYKGLGLKEGSFPIVERCAAEFVSLPMFPELTVEQVDYVAEGLSQAILTEKVA